MLPKFDFDKSQKPNPDTVSVYKNFNSFTVTFWFNKEEQTFRTRQIYAFDRNLTYDEFISHLVENLKVVDLEITNQEPGNGYRILRLRTIKASR